MAMFSGVGQRSGEECTHGEQRGSGMECILFLQELAFDEPSERSSIVKRLEGFAAGRKGRAATAAYKAAANITAVSMMEILHEL